VTTIFTVIDGKPIVRVTQICSVCGESTTVLTDPNGFIRWSEGELVQNAFPELSKEDREILISGTHSECWNKLFRSYE
jgi:hypothetical protein